MSMGGKGNGPAAQKMLASKWHEQQTRKGAKAAQALQEAASLQYTPPGSPNSPPGSPKYLGTDKVAGVRAFTCYWRAALSAGCTASACAGGVGCH
jgi:hypothetical protein